MFQPILIYIATAFASSPSQLDLYNEVVPEHAIQEINKQSQWVASKRWVKDMTVQQARKMMGTKLTKRLSNLSLADPDPNYPAFFNITEKWESCLHPIRDQSHCGSCWAFAASETLSDRFCIASNNTVNVVLSPQYLVSCDTDNYGCDGGYLDLAWEFLTDNGIPTDECVPYTSGGGNDGQCTHGKCSSNNETAKLYRATGYKELNNAKLIQKSLYEEGSVQTGFVVYQDFMSYQNGIYEHVWGEEVGGHSVKIIGWGTDSIDGRLYWVCANSWGADWGLSGYFNIYADQCDISAEGIAGDADIQVGQIDLQIIVVYGHWEGTVFNGILTILSKKCCRKISNKIWL